MGLFHSATELMIEANHYKPWSGSEDAVVRQFYDGTHDSLKHIHSLIGRTHSGILHRVQLHNLSKSTKLRAVWTAEEEEWLSDHYSDLPMAELRKYFGFRSVSSIISKAFQLGLKKPSRCSSYTHNDLIKYLRTSSTRIHSWIDSGKLKATYEKDKSGSAKLIRVQESDLLKFICKYPSELQGRNIDMVWLIDLLAHGK